MQPPTRALCQHPDCTRAARIGVHCLRHADGTDLAAYERAVAHHRAAKRPPRLTRKLRQRLYSAGTEG